MTSGRLSDETLDLERVAEFIRRLFGFQYHASHAVAPHGLESSDTAAIGFER
jgi:hypothetical protein